MKQKKLFAVLLGGRASGCHIELHDIVFAVGDSLEETYPRLVHKWFGIHKRLHVDSSIELDVVDGHKIQRLPVKNEELSANELNKVYPQQTLDREIANVAWIL